VIQTKYTTLQIKYVNYVTNLFQVVGHVWYLEELQHASHVKQIIKKLEINVLCVIIVKGMIH
jgi:hypothetical protein